MERGPQLEAFLGADHAEYPQHGPERAVAQIAQCHHAQKKDSVTVRREHVNVKTDHSVGNVMFEVIPLRMANAHEPYLMIVFEGAHAEREQRQGIRRQVIFTLRGPWGHS